MDKILNLEVEIADNGSIFYKSKPIGELTVEFDELVKFYEKDLPLEAKIKLSSDSDEEFLYYMLGTAGSFTTQLFNAFARADYSNKSKLLSVFPQLKHYSNYLINPKPYDEKIKAFRGH